MFSILENRAAKLYARQLPARLRQAYGHPPPYTAAQIRAAAAKLKLPEKYVCFGYAAFLSCEEYAALAAEMPRVIPYEEARAKFARFARPASAATGNDALENPYVQDFSPD